MKKNNLFNTKDMSKGEAYDHIFSFLTKQVIISEKRFNEKLWRAGKTKLAWLIDYGQGIELVKAAKIFVKEEGERARKIIREDNDYNP